MKELSLKIVKFIKNYVKSSGAKGVVVGMSGGKDSLIVAKLCELALGKNCVFGLIMPNGNMADLDLAKQQCEYLNIWHDVVNIKELASFVNSETKRVLHAETISDVSTTNTPPRLRMTMLYSVAGSLGYLVANTSNLSETMIGYSTKWGDNVGDFSPIKDLTKTEVCELGLELGLPADWVTKTPDDGLSGKSDEEKIGFSYSELDAFIRNGKKGTNFDKIQRMHNISEHKRALPKTFKTKRKNNF